jgi:hypothetical protein
VLSLLFGGFERGHKTSGIRLPGPVPAQLAPAAGRGIRISLAPPAA